MVNTQKIILTESPYIEKDKKVQNLTDFKLYPHSQSTIPPFTLSFIHVMNRNNNNMKIMSDKTKTMKMTTTTTMRYGSDRSGSC